MQTKLIVSTTYESSELEVYAGKQSVTTIAGFARKLKLSAVSVVKLIQHWRDTRKQRRDLHGLSDYMLKDIGISRYEALREAEKPFWKE